MQHTFRTSALLTIRVGDTTHKPAAWINLHLGHRMRADDRDPQPLHDGLDRYSLQTGRQLTPVFRSLPEARRPSRAAQNQGLFHNACPFLGQPGTGSRRAANIEGTFDPAEGLPLLQIPLRLNAVTAASDDRSHGRSKERFPAQSTAGKCFRDPNRVLPFVG